MSNVKQPNLRFKGYTDDWVEQKLGDIFKTVPSKKYIVKAQQSGDYPVIQQGNHPIAGHTNGNTYNNYQNVILFGDHTNSLFNPTKPFGLATDGVKILKSESLEPNFFYQLILNYKPTEVGYKRHLKQVKETTGLIPTSLHEQSQIGSLLSHVDQAITYAERELKSLQLLKRGYLQQMFPKAGQDKPALRFKGFNDKWQQVKLGDVAEITMGQSPSSEYYSETPSKYVLVQGNADLKNGKIQPRIWTRQGNKFTNKNDILFTVRAPVGELAVAQMDAVIGRGVASIKGNLIIYYDLENKTRTKYWNRFSTGTTFKSVSSNILKNTSLLLPTSSSEQRQIGQFFKALDAQVSSAQIKLEKLKSFKKSLLQQMFI